MHNIKYDLMFVNELVRLLSGTEFINILFSIKGKLTVDTQQLGSGSTWPLKVRYPFTFRSHVNPAWSVAQTVRTLVCWCVMLDVCSLSYEPLCKVLEEMLY